MTENNDNTNSAVPALRYALRYMASSPNYTHLKQEIVTLSKTDHGGFVGNESCLNVLVEWARENGPDSLKPFWRVSDPEHARLFPGAKKTQYQGSYMAQRRERQRKAVSVLEQMEQRKLRTKERDAFKRDIQALWMLYRDEYVHEFRPGAKRNEAAKQFWQMIDDRLDKGLAGNNYAAQQALGKDEEAWLRGLTPP